MTVQSNRSRGSRSSPSSASLGQSSSRWDRRDSSPSPGNGTNGLSQISQFMNTQDLRAGVLDLMDQATRNARSSSGGASEDILDAEPRPSKRSKTSSDSSPTKPGRGIRKIIDLYHDLTTLFTMARNYTPIDGLSRESIEELNRFEFSGMTEEEIEEERKDRKRCHSALKLLNILVPDFEQKAAAADNTSHYCAPLQSGANDARSDDTSRLKIAVTEWLNDGCPPCTSGSITPSHLSAKRKEERGINHDITGYLLCPIDYEWDDPIIRAKLRNAESGYDFTSSFFLRCLYEYESGDPEQPAIGFLKGTLLLRAYRHIFTAPSSASREETSESTSRRRDVATSLGINGHVTARSIAYTATQLIFSLNSARDWKHEHAGFHYPSFYNFIVDFFEDCDDGNAKKLVEELLQWWNIKIYPATAHRAGGQISRNVLKSSQRRLWESCSRQIPAVP